MVITPQQRLRAVLVFALVAALALPAASSARDYLTQARTDADALDVARAYIDSVRDDHGLFPADLGDMEVTDRYVSRHTGVTHVYMRQRHEGLSVVNGLANINVAKDGRVINLWMRFVPGLEQAVNTIEPVLSRERAIRQAAAHLGLAAPAISPVADGVFAGGTLSQDDIKVRLRLFADGGEVRLAWEMGLRLHNNLDYWQMWIDAVDGRVLDKHNWVASDTYEVFAMPLESPDHGPRTIEVDPADMVASPLAWHDTDGNPGAEFTDTRGNNVSAQEDRDANNSGGFRPDGGPDLEFEFPLDLTLPPVDYQAAAITNLFYWNNVIHDVWYQYGFDEASGNFQENNYGNGGAGSDSVNADAQDGSGFNNANMLTLPDGSNPRMQMFEWISPFPNILEMLMGDAAGEYTSSGAEFGPAFDVAGITGMVVLADDGSGADVNDGCEALVNGGDIAGNIAMINRGSCNFVLKVRNAQDVGATAVVVVNNTGGTPITMGDDGTGGDIVIPSGMIAMADGDLIKPTLPAGANMRSAGDTSPNRDSDLDNGVIAHEYGHGVSNRLTGGPGNVSCLNNQEQMGEGWSDWHGLVLTAKETDTGEMPRGIGNYVIFAPIDGNGIRTFPYSTDMTINPHTYDDIMTESIPHGVGSVWSAMIWEMYWNLVTRDGFDPDFYNGTGGNNTAMQLVMDGMKMQPCSPSFTDGRDAILDADMVLTGGENRCLIWESFAKRGLGVSSDAGSAFSVTDGTEAFDVPEDCNCAMNIEIGKTEFAPGEAVGFDLVLQHNRAQTVDVPFLLWIENAAGEVVGGKQSQPRHMESGDFIRHKGTFKLPNDLAPGRYRLVASVKEMRQGRAWNSRGFRVSGIGDGDGDGEKPEPAGVAGIPIQ